MEWADWRRTEHGRYRNDLLETEAWCDGLTLHGSVKGVKFRLPMDVLVTMLAERGVELVERPRNDAG